MWTLLSDVAVARRGDEADGCGREDHARVLRVGEWRVVWWWREGTLSRGEGVDMVVVATVEVVNDEACC